jgi:hypothetical protein
MSANLFYVKINKIIYPLKLNGRYLSKRKEGVTGERDTEIEQLLIKDKALFKKVITEGKQVAI